MADVELNAVSKRYGQNLVCREINLKIGDGEFVTLLGASGCGKTTTLNLIAGLEDPTTGDVLIGRRNVTELSPLQRDVAMVFQNYALYPHKTVRDNMAFTLKLRRMPRAEIAARVNAAAEALEIEHLLDRLPSQLSGGQQQRVAIGRAIVRQPSVFLFDEPFSNLDAMLRVKMRAEVKELHHRLGVTSVFVTHDQEEAMSMSDRIVVMHQGVVAQVGTPEKIYVRPANRYVATFVGNPRMELLPATLETGTGVASVRMGDISFPLVADGLPSSLAGQAVEIGIRPEHVALLPPGEGLPAQVRLVQPMGPVTHLALTFAGHELLAAAPGISRLRAGEPVGLRFDPAHLLVFDGATGERLLPVS